MNEWMNWRRVYQALRILSWGKNRASLVIEADEIEKHPFRFGAQSGKINIMSELWEYEGTWAIKTPSNCGFYCTKKPNSRKNFQELIFRSSIIHSRTCYSKSQFYSNLLCIISLRPHQKWNFVKQTIKNMKQKRKQKYDIDTILCTYVLANRPLLMLLRKL